MNLQVFCIFATLTGTLFLSASSAAVAGEECPSLLPPDDTSKASTADGIFINTQYPVQCSGTAVRWRYCSGGDDDDDDDGDSYTVTLVLYNANSSPGEHYTRVDGSQIVARVAHPYAGCSSYDLTPDEQFEVTAGTVIGVCLQSDDRKMSVISKDIHGYFLMYKQTQCADSRLGSLAAVQRRLNHAMHVSLVIRSHEDSLTPPLLPKESTFSKHPSITTVTVASSDSSISSTTVPTTISSTITHLPVTVTETIARIVALPSNSVSSSPQKAFGVPVIAAIVGSLAIVMAAAVLTCMAIAFIVRSRKKKKYIATHSPQQHTDISATVTENPNTKALQTPREYEESLHVSKMVPKGVKSLQELAGLITRRISEQHCEFDSGFQRHNEVQKGNTSQRHRVDGSPHYEFDSEYRPEENEASTENWPAASFYDRTYPLQGNYADLPYSILCPHNYKVLEMRSLKDSEESTYFEPASNEIELYMQLQKQKLKHIPQGDIKTTSRLGSGQFGQVSKGIWKQNGSYVHVAMKMLSSAAPTENKVKLLQEAAIMGQFMHPNVINLLGVVIKTKIMLVMELASKGDLKSHLHSLMTVPGKSPNPDTNKTLLSFTQQIAIGMQYLSSKGFVHRDLAARNILLTEGNLCKIADFGMSRNLEDTNYYVSQGGKIPVKWTAPEAIHFKKYSTASDVWSYGCLLYEIWSLGKTPFQWCTNVKVVEELQTGYRLPPPPGCPKIIYLLMMRCWNSKPSERPTFRDIIILLMEPEVKILEIPEEDLFTRDLAGELGGPLEAGEMMYPKLQREYRPNI